MGPKAKFKVLYSEEATDFLNSLDVKAKDKILYNIKKSMYLNDPSLFKKLEGHEIWEFRTLYSGLQYRLFAFWDKDAETYVIATHGFVKKTQKTPAKEIARAEEIMKEYFNDKNK